MELIIQDHIEQLEDIPEWYRGTNEEYKQFLFECPICGWNTNSIHYQDYDNFIGSIMNHMEQKHPHIHTINKVIK